MKEQNTQKMNMVSNPENKNSEAADEQKEQDYQKLVNLMKSIKCMPESNSKVEMYRQVADKFSALSGYKEAEKCAGECRNSAEKTDKAIKKTTYEIALNKKKKAKQTADYKSAAESFKEVRGYLDADVMVTECEQLIERIEIKKAKKRLFRFGIAVVFILAFLVGMHTSHAKYYLANTYMFTHSYSSAIKMYNKLGPYKDCTERLMKSEYLYGVKAESKSEFENARKAFAAAGDYKDSEVQKVNMEKQIIKNSKVGSYVNIGDCKWEVLDLEDSQALLLKKTALPVMAYNDNPGDVTWESSSLRKWLNSDFLNNTFSESEQKNMVLSDVKNNASKTYHTDGGNDTKDYTFLLSIEEAEKYSDLFPAFKNNGWLRSPGNNQGSAAFLSVSGKVMDYGYAATDRDEFTVRPAFWFNLG